MHIGSKGSVSQLTMGKTVNTSLIRPSHEPRDGRSKDSVPTEGKGLDRNRRGGEREKGTSPFLEIGWE